jgi:hypothetical protein
VNDKSAVSPEVQGNEPSFPQLDQSITNNEHGMGQLNPAGEALKFS